MAKKHKTGLRHATQILNQIKQTNPHLFYHWKKGTAIFIKGNTSCMMGDHQVRFRERLAGEIPACLLGAYFACFAVTFFSLRSFIFFAKP